MNMNDLRLRNKSTHARGLVILLLSLIFRAALVIDLEQLRWLEVIKLTLL